MSPTVLHCVLREGLSAVFPSQVLTPISTYRRAGWNVRLLVLAPVGELTRAETRAVWNRQRGLIRGVLEDDFDVLPTLPARFRSRRVDRAIFSAWLRRQPWAHKDLILHCRGRPMTAIALDVAQACDVRPKVIFDCRGLGHEDPGRVLRGRPTDSPLDADRDVARRSDATICVSRAMARTLSPSDASQYWITPCAVDTAHFGALRDQRERRRNELGLSNSFVVVYCGSLTPWQLPEHSARIFHLLRRNIKEARFLAVTTQPRTMERRLRDLGIDDAITVSSPHDEVGEWLAAGDIGLLLRDRTLFNKVASPVKFGEYLASGLPVIMTEDIGDFSELASNHELGLVVRLEQSDSELGSLVQDFGRRVATRREEFVNRCQAAAREHLDVRVRAETINTLYQELVAEFR